MMPNDPVVGGNILRRPAIRSPNFIPGVQGWTINSDGTAQFNQLTLIVQSSQAGVLIYLGVAALGTLIGSWSGFATTDQFGNVVPAGLFASQGQLAGMTISNSTLVSAILSNPTITGGSWSNPTITGGTIIESTIVLDTTGGQVLGYGQVTTTVTNPASPWTPPAGVTVAKVECKGSAAGGGGGNTTQGGEAGGAGEYSCEPNLPVSSTQSYQIIVPTGGFGGSTGSAGTSGSDAVFGSNLVVGHGGDAGSAGAPGPGGTGSTNTIHHDGGSGGTGNLGVAGAGGGGSAGSTGAGGNGGNGGAGAGAGGAAGAGGGAAGGAGGASGAAGNNGTGLGAGGGGAGKGTTSTNVTETFFPSSTRAYRTDGGLQNTNGNMLHGAYSGEPGYGYTYIQWNTSNLGHALNDVLNGVFGTVKSVTLRLFCLHCWNNSGMTWGLHSSTILGGGVGSYSTILGSFSAVGDDQNPSQSHRTYTLTAGQWAPFKAGGTTYLVLGPDASDEFNLGWYGYFWGAGGSTANQPLLTVNYNTVGSGSVNAGDGEDGFVKITYQTSTSLAFALAPIVGNDAAGNQWGAGYTGPVQAFQPGSAPTIVETWHTITGAAGLTGTIRCKKLADSNMVVLDIDVSWAGTGAQTFNLGSLPTSAYYPTVFGSGGGARVYPLGTNQASTAAYTAGNFPRVFVPSSGGLQILAPASAGGASNAAATIMWPTD